MFLKLTLIIFFIISGAECGNAQSVIDSAVIKPRYWEYERYIYDPETKTINFSYDYSNKWDLDGDNKNDSVYLIGNGGAHTYFYPKIILSSNGLTQSFTFLQLDNPWFESKEILDKWGINSVIQFVVHDFTGDGIMEIYFKLNNPTAHIRRKWKHKGINTDHIIMSFEGGKMRFINYKL